MRKPSRVVALRKVPVSASRGAKATACTTISSSPHSRFSSSKAAAHCPSTVTSSGIVRRDPSEWASGSTRSRILSFTYEKASCAPSRCIACAMPQAIERSVATPTMKARLPARNPIRLCLPAGIMPEKSTRSAAPRTRASARRPWRDSAVACREVDAQLLAGAQMRVTAQAVPGEELRHAALEQACDQRHRVTLTHRVLDMAAVDATARIGREPDVLPGAQRITGLQAVQGREGVDVHAGAARNGPERISAAHDLHMGTRPAHADAAIDARGGEHHLGG